MASRAATDADGIEALFESAVPADELPWYLAPLPERVENLGLNLVWLVVAVNLAGTAFGFWFYGTQLADTPARMWVFVPDSPMATLFIALALAAWKLGHPQAWLLALAFLGNIILGSWTVYVHLVFWDAFGYLHPAMRQFLIWSHAAMVLQAFLLPRIGEFEPWALAAATLWYAVDTVFDYVVPVDGEFTHTFLPVARDEPVAFGLDALAAAGVGSVLPFALAVGIAVSIRRRRTTTETR
jgi:uncharacterized membrane protein YpjA